MAKPESVTSRVLDQLETLHHQRRSRRFVRSLIWAAAIVLFVSAVAVVLDAFFGWWSIATRVAISGIALLATLAWLIPAMRKTFFRDDSETLASFADQRTPVMQERMQTLISASQYSAPETGVDRLMLQRVAIETDGLIDQFNPHDAAEESSFQRPLVAVGAGILIWLAMAIFIGSDLGILLGRFLAPTSALTRFQVDGIPGNTVVARGEPFTLELTGKGATTSSITLERCFDGDDSIDSPAIMESIELVSEDRQFQFRQRRSDASFAYRIISGDLRTPWSQVTVASRPRVKNVSLIVTPPEYSHLPSKTYSRMPNRLTVLEGSRIELTATVTGDAELAMLQIENEAARTMLAQTDEKFVVSFPAEKEMKFELEVTEVHGLKNLRRPNCHLLTRPDLPPSVRIDSPSPDQEVRPDDTIELRFTAKDDVGLARAKLIVQIEQQDPSIGADGKPSEPIVLETVDLPVPNSKGNDGKPLTNWQGGTKLDLSRFKLKEGQTLSYRIEVFDTKQAEILESSESERDLPDSESMQSPKSPMQSDSDSSDSAAPPTQSSSIETSKNSTSNQPNDSGKSEPNPVEMRNLDLPQPSSSKPRRLKVTENVSSFVSESRRKSEVEIARTFRAVDGSLQAARQALSRILNDYESSVSQWVDRHGLAAMEAHQELDHATVSIKDLIQRTKETPYAFIGLQLAEIAHTHIIPAREDAQAVNDNSGETRWALVTASRQQVIRALERLQSLYKTYEKAKQDFEVAKNVQEIEKMYRVYLEDALAELKRASEDGDGNPGLERTMAELDIDADYLARLKEVLEMQRDLRAELAKILADDPRLMRRYFQNFGQSGRSIRDQIYDLAKLQRGHYELTESYGKATTSSSQSELTKTINGHASTLAIEAMGLVERCLEVEEMFETWLPLDEKETPSIRAARDSFLNIAAAAGDVTTVFEDEVAYKIFAAQDDVTQDDLKKLFGSSAVTMKGLAIALDAAASTLAALSDDDPELVENATRRMVDLQQLHSSVARWHTMSAMASEQLYLSAIGVSQVDTANQTHDLTEKLTGLQRELARQISEDGSTLPKSIAEACDELLQKLDREIEPLQLASIRALQQANMTRATQRLEAATSGLDEACRLIDNVLKQVIELLDQLPPDPLGDLLDDPTLNEILTQLEQERELSELLGIPGRPTNLQVVNDWANGANGPGGAARMRLLKMIREATNSEQKKRLKKLMQTRKELFARHGAASSKLIEGELDRGSVFGWNILRSQLGGSLLQESDGLPPETYRSSIERYFEIISSAGAGQ